MTSFHPFFTETEETGNGSFFETETRFWLPALQTQFIAFKFATK